MSAIPIQRAGAGQGAQSPCPLSAQPTGLPPRLVQLRERYGDLDAMASCSQAAGNLIPLRGNIYSRRVEAAEDAAIRNYANLCLKPDLMMYGSELTEAEKQALVDRLVLLVDSDGDIACHGFRLGVHVITAKHCVQDVAPPATPAVWRVRTVRSSKLYEATEVELGNRGIDPDEQPNLDYALLRLARFEGAPDDPGEWLGTVAAGEQLIVLQSNMYQRYVHSIKGAVDLAESVMIQNNPVCYARVVTSEGYIFHPCQTEWGTSGAPLLQRDASGRIHLVGVHGGSIRRVPGDLATCASTVPNQGIQVPVGELLAAMRNRP
jgi:hypothetical protein